MYRGKFRAIVTNINDPDKMGRIKVQCPKLFGEYESSWCLPCVPYSSDDAGFIMLPKVGDMVWIEFEDNDPALPIWVGCLWKQNSTPIDSRYEEGSTLRVIKVKDLVIELDENVGIKIYNKNKAGITITNDNNIVISASRVDFKQL